MESVVGILQFLQDYVVTFVFALGVISFLYGYVNSFILSRPDIGHAHLLRALVFFVMALVLFGILAFLQWTLSFYSAVREEQERLPGAEIERDRSFLPAPNVPRR